MWMSMTGFGRGERHGEEISVTVEARTVNHRFLDLHTRCPGRFLSWEPRIRGIVRDSVRRGKVDLHVNVREWGKLGAGLRVNDELLRSFLGEAKRIREEHGVGGEVTLRDLLSVPDLFQTA
ncbi:MAG TPA: YicC/YloC family endoribonuclease, partial [Candidatus Deferrimicrobium sp.]